MNIESTPDTATAAQERKELVRGPFLVGGREVLTEDLATTIVQLLMAMPKSAPNGVLAGRGNTGMQTIEGMGRVFVKQYAHGGLLRKITRGRFLCGKESRSLREFLMLEKVRSLGINAPRPYVYVTKGSFFYQSWLLMEEVVHARNLVELSSRDLFHEENSDAARSDLADPVHDAMRKLGEQVLLLVKNGIFHVDLHPGNVLVRDDGTVCIVDFDKARVFQGSTESLRELYLRRWRRAVIKHNLSPVLTELMSVTLRSYHD
jgi:3-deoxy-D-manno-octulosonic acid kinase